MKLINDIVTYTLSLIASVLLLYVILGSIAIAKADPSPDFLSRYTTLQPHQIAPLPIPQPMPNGFAVYERERPLPPQWGVDSYKSYKVIPLDRYGQPTQPLVTFDEVLTDMVWGSLHKKENK
jgi:hypothetical protein